MKVNPPAWAQESSELGYVVPLLIVLVVVFCLVIFGLGFAFGWFAHAALG